MPTYPIESPYFEEYDYGAYITISNQSVIDNGGGSYTISFSHYVSWPVGYGFSVNSGMGLYYIGEWTDEGPGEYRYWGVNDPFGPLYSLVTWDIDPWVGIPNEITFTIGGDPPPLYWDFYLWSGDPAISTFITNINKPFPIANVATITTLPADQIGYAGQTARLNGSGGNAFTYNYFQYGQNELSLNLATSQKAGTATFSEFISGLNPAVVYYFRAVGKTGSELTYGDTLSFLSPGSVTPPVSTPTPGYQWVEGTTYHYIDSSGVERSTVGTLVGGTGKSGHIWKEDDAFHYIDETGAERKVDMANYQPEGFEYTFDFFFDGEI